MRRRIIINILLLVLIGAIIIILAVSPKPVGGELYRADFADGFLLYVEESYIQRFTDGVFTQTPHSIWLVTEERLRNEIFRLCINIKQYRELDCVNDTMLGAPLRLEFFPVIFFETDSFIYRISAINWGNFTSSAYAYYPIRNELFGGPVFQVSRLDLSQFPATADPYSYSRDYSRSDSLNSERGVGWYSTISREHFDKLLLLVQNISYENAEIVWSHIVD